METSDRIKYFDVLAITKKLCSSVTGNDYEILKMDLMLEEDNTISEYISVIACDNKTKEELISKMGSYQMMKKEDYLRDVEGCHITTYKKGNQTKEISFNENDDFPIKADFSEEYKYADIFFRKFISFRNLMIRTNQVIKEDDIYQYYSCIVEAKEKNEKNQEKFKEKAKRFMSSR